MTPITFWFDPISPYAHLAFEHLPQALEGHSVVVDYKPILFGALLKHHEHKGPAEIEPKRQWTFRQVAWLGHQLGIRIDLPAQHPFNPLPLLRLMLAAAPNTTPSPALPNRAVVQAVLNHVWHGGLDPLDPQRLQVLQQQLAPAGDVSGEEVRTRLRTLTDEAVSKGIFGVPTLEVQGRLFWGLDALPMVKAALSGDPWFEEQWAHAARRVPGLRRDTP